MTAKIDVFKLGDTVRVFRNRTTSYGQQPPIGSIGTVIRADIDLEYVCLDIAPGGVYIDELELYVKEWDT